jgi:hypothetical protein
MGLDIYKIIFRVKPRYSHNNFMGCIYVRLAPYAAYS